MPWMWMRCWPIPTCASSSTGWRRRARFQRHHSQEEALTSLRRQASRLRPPCRRDRGGSRCCVRSLCGWLPACCREIRVVHHHFDDSVFIDDTYIVKGVAGALLRLMLSRGTANDGRDASSPPTATDWRPVLGRGCPRSRTTSRPACCSCAGGSRKKHAPIQVSARFARGRLASKPAGRSRSTPAANEESFPEHYTAPKSKPPRDRSSRSVR